MKQQQPNLSDFFAKARSAPPVVSEADIDALLDEVDLHGRQSAQQENTQTEAPSYSQNKNRKRIVMGSIAAVLFGTVLSTGIIFFSPEKPNQILQVPAIVGTSILHENQSTPNAKEKTAPAESILAAKTPAQTESLQGRGDGAKTDVPADPKKEDKGEEVSKIGDEISRELQTLIENYWIDKVNGYKARIDGMMSRESLDELNRLRIRWALTNKEDSPLRFAAMTEMNMVDSKGDEAKIQAGLGNNDAPEMAMPQIEGGENGKGQVHIAFGFQADNISEELSDTTVNRTVEKHVIVFHHNDETDPAELEGVQEKEINVEMDGTETKEIKVAIRRNDGEKIILNDNGDRTIIIKKEDVVTRDGEKSGREMPMMEDGMKMEIKDLDMTPLVGMLKMAISSDKSESSQIMVATWKVAEDHRPALDDLKQQVMNDVTAFTDMVRRRMADYVAQHGEELPAEMREIMAGKLDDEEEADQAAELIKTLEPIYDVIVEPMLMLYNGSDINGVLTSAIAEPVAGITLEANSTLKQSYPNPASTEATIEYNLQEPSTRTTLRIFDAQGSEVRTMNLGPQSAGAHQEVVNVKDLPGGTYLYHLTVGTSRGDQVYSKTMQIAR